MPVGGRAFSSPAIAIFGGATRKGSWVVPRAFQAFALFGGVEIDLRDASLEDREVTIYANAIFGGVDITVPEGVAVITSGAGIMGGYDGPSDDGGAPNGPVIHIKGIAIFGGVDVRRKPPSTPKQPKPQGTPRRDRDTAGDPAAASPATPAVGQRTRLPRPAVGPPLARSSATGGEVHAGVRLQLLDLVPALDRPDRSALRAHHQ